MEEPAPNRIQPTPLRYHRELLGFLRTEEPGLWEWFSSKKVQEEQFEAQRLDILKTTVRLDAETHPDLHDTLTSAAERLGIDAPLRVYQAQNASAANACIAFMPGEVHLIFSGPVLSLLSKEELHAVLAHELAHYLLWQWEEGAYLTATRLLDGSASHPGAANCHQQTARSWSLYTEIFADRVSLEVTGDLEACVAALVKAETGLTQVSGRGYLQQAAEILEKGDVRSLQITHPELFIRARALQLWHEAGEEAETQIAAMLDRVETLEELDWLGQSRLTKLTRRFVAELLRPRWFRTDAVLAHAALFFEDFEPSESDDASLHDEIRALSPKLREYFAWILADFAVADRSLEDLPLAAALDWSARLELDAAFDKIASKELKVKTRALKKLKKEAAEMLQNAGAEA
jgi:hypothetical protein